MTLRDRFGQLQHVSPEIEAKIKAACKAGTMRAVEKAADLTPPLQDDLRGTNTRSGEAKQHWATDSKVQPKRSGNVYSTLLANDKDYISYVNDGHRMDRHFVPGLYINPSSGLLEYDPGQKGGIVVGTRTSYVPGLHMTDEAEKVYHETVKQELEGIREVFE